MRARILLPLVIIALFAACKKKEVSEFTDTPVIEAYLNPNNYLNVKISRQVPFSSDVTYSSDDINNLSVQMICNNTVYTLKPIGNGEYMDSSHVVNADATYSLAFTFNSKDVKAYTYIPSRPQTVTQSTTEISIQKIDSTTGRGSGGFTMPDPIEITWSNPDRSYYMVLVENTETSPEAIRDFGTGTAPAQVFRKAPSNSSTEEIRSMEFQYFGKTRIILFHVLPDYAALYNQSSTSSQNLSNPSTSIVNGYGIFTGLSSDTLWVNVKKL